MRKLLIALLATATLPAALHAQDEPSRDADAPARPERVREQTPEPRFQPAEPRFQREAVVETGFRAAPEQVEAPSEPRAIQIAAEDRRDRGNRPDRGPREDRPNGFKGRADGNAGFQRPDSQPDRRRFDTPPAPATPAAQPQRAPDNAWSRDDRTRAARDRSDWNRNNNRGGWNRPDDRNDANRSDANRRDWDRNNDGRPDWNRNNDGRPDWNRNGNDRRDGNRNDNNRRDWDRNNDGRRDWGWNDRNDGRWNGNDRNFRNWDRGWRNNNRYDWQRYRSSNRSAFRLPRYYAPHGWNYGYRRFSIGATLYFGLFDQDYWISDPWAYRLPPVYWPYQWVRYYNDALLVDTRSGYVVDVIPDIFWY